MRTATMEQEKLLPCPFCGSGDVTESIGETGDGKPFTYIECSDCAATAEPDMWNRRSPSAELGRMGGGEQAHASSKRIYTKLDVESLVATALAAKEQRERLREFNEQTDILLGQAASGLPTCKQTFTCKECSQDLFKCRCYGKARRQAPPPPPADVPEQACSLDCDDGTIYTNGVNPQPCPECNGKQPPADVQAVVEGRDYDKEREAVLELLRERRYPDRDSLSYVPASIMDRAITFLQHPFSEELRQAMLAGSNALHDESMRRIGRDESGMKQLYHYSTLLTRAAEGEEKP
jgi:hypothetical protein